MFVSDDRVLMVPDQSKSYDGAIILMSNDDLILAEEEPVTPIAVDRVPYQNPNYY